MSPTDRRYHFKENVRDLPPGQYRKELAAMLQGVVHENAMLKFEVPASYATAEPADGAEPGTATGTTSSTAKAPAPATGGGRGVLDMSPSEYAAAKADMLRRSGR